MSAGINTEVRQTDLDQQGHHLLVIFENHEATLRITLSETEKYLRNTEPTFSNLSCS